MKQTRTFILLLLTRWLYLLQEVPHGGLLLLRVGAEVLLVQHLQQDAQLTHQHLHCCTDGGKAGAHVQFISRESKGQTDRSKQTKGLCVRQPLSALLSVSFFHFLTLYFTVCQCQSHAASSSPLSDTSQTQQPHKDGVTGNRFANCSLTSRKSGSEATKNHTSLHRTQKRNYSCNN